MELQNFIITPVAGAIIGYFTNWLAIKMLFRPHGEKYLFGIKLPFTPGLMPKERYNLSKKIGETVAEHVITKDMLKSEILNEEAVNNVTVLIREILGDLAESKITVSEAFNWAEIKADEFFSGIEKAFMDAAGNYFRSEAFDSLIKSVLKDIESGFYDKDKSIKDFLPENTEEFLKNGLRRYIPKAAELVKRLPYDNTEIDISLNLLISKIIDENVGTFAGMFINKGKVYENIRNGFYEYLSDEKNLELITDKAGSFITGVLGRSTSDYPAFEKIFLFISNNVNGELTDKILNRLIAETQKLLPQFRSFVLSYPIGKIISVTKAIDSHSALHKLVYYALDKTAVQILQGVDIGKVAERQINSFDLQKAEDIVLDVVKKELNAITIVGGVLGFIIGLMTALINIRGF